MKHLRERLAFAIAPWLKPQPTFWVTANTTATAPIRYGTFDPTTTITTGWKAAG